MDCVQFGKMVDSIDCSFYKYFVIPEAVKRAKSLAFQINQHYGHPIDLKKTVASQAAQKACRILHQKAMKKSHRPTEEHKQSLNMLKSLHMMIGIARIIKLFAIYEPIIERHFHWHKYQQSKSKKFGITFLLPSSLKNMWQI